MRRLAEQSDRGVPEDQNKEGDDVFWPSAQGQLESCKLHRCVSVPLAVLWSCCPKVSALSGSLSNLRHLLMDVPEVKLSPDGSAVLVKDQEQDLEEDLEDSGYAEASQCSHSAEQGEDWEANV